MAPPNIGAITVVLLESYATLQAIGDGFIEVMNDTTNTCNAVDLSGISKFAPNVPQPSIDVPSMIVNVNALYTIPTPFDPLTGMNPCDIALSIPTLLQVLLKIVDTLVKSFLSLAADFMDLLILVMNSEIVLRKAINDWWTATKNSINGYISSIRTSLKNKFGGDKYSLSKIMKTFNKEVDKIMILVRKIEPAFKKFEETLENMADSLEDILYDMGVAIEESLRAVKCISKIQSLGAV